MNKLKYSIILLIQFTLGTAQSVFKVENKMSQLYLNVPNPISYCHFGVKAEELGIAVNGGELDTINGLCYWTPTLLPDSKSPFLVFYKTSLDQVLDTVYCFNRIINPEKFTGVPVAPNFTITDGYPNCLRIQRLKPEVDFEFSHIPLDSLITILEFDARLLGKDKVLIEHLPDLTNDDLKFLRSKLEDQQIKWIQFVNIKIESKIWNLDCKDCIGHARNSEVYSLREE